MLFNIDLLNVADLEKTQNGVQGLVFEIRDPGMRQPARQLELEVVGVASPDERMVQVIFCAHGPVILVSERSGVHAASCR